jgi:hypothetical protein
VGRTIRPARPRTPWERIDVSDEKTRIIPRGKIEPATTEPQLVGDKIVFFCPNGDKVVVSAKDAGKRGQCSKCKVPVVIPMLRKRRPSQPVSPGAEEPEPSPEGETEAEAEAAAAEEAEAEPAAPEVEASDDAASADASADAAPAEPPAASEWQFVGEAESSHAGFEPQPGQGGDWPPPPPFGEPGQPAEHPAARLAARLWMERDQGGIFELHLSGGSVILPEWFEPNWSRGSHGLFASQAADGSITLTAVAWDTIEKIVVRQVPAVPDGMFE